MDSLAYPDREKDVQPLPVVFAERTVCTPLSILESLMAPRTFERPSEEQSQDVPGEGEEIFASDADDSSFAQSSQHEEQKILSESTENYIGNVLREKRGSSVRVALPEEREEPVLQSLAEEGPGSALSTPPRQYVDGTLPDLLRSGSPLRRRVSSPVSNTVSEKETDTDCRTLHPEDRVGRSFA